MTSSSDQRSALVHGMLDSIANFERGNLMIDRLSSDLKIRIAALEGLADRAWVEELRTMRNDIELVSAVFLRSHREVLSDAERHEVGGILDKLKAALGTR